MVTMGMANPKAAVLSELAYVTGALRVLGVAHSSTDSTRRLGGVMEGMAQKLENAMYTIDSDLQEAQDHDAEPYDQAQA